MSLVLEASSDAAVTVLPTGVPPTAPEGAWIEPRPYRFLAATYERLGEIGFFDPAERLELLDGEIVHMSPIGLRHALTVSWLSQRFAQEAHDRFLIWPGNPLRLSDYSEPQPDFMLIPFNTAMVELPRPENVFLLVEVSDTTLSHDRTRKLRLYAEGGILEYWIVNLQEDCIEVFRSPAVEGYLEQHRYARGEKVGTLAFPDLGAQVDQIIPPR